MAITEIKPDQPKVSIEDEIPFLGDRDHRAAGDPVNTIEDLVKLDFTLEMGARGLKELGTAAALVEDYIGNGAVAATQVVGGLKASAMPLELEQLFGDQTPGLGLNAAPAIAPGAAPLAPPQLQVLKGPNYNMFS